MVEQKMYAQAVRFGKTTRDRLGPDASRLLEPWVERSNHLREHVPGWALALGEVFRDIPAGLRVQVIRLFEWCDEGGTPLERSRRAARVVEASREELCHVAIHMLVGEAWPS